MEKRGQGAGHLAFCTDDVGPIEEDLEYVAGGSDIWRGVGLIVRGSISRGPCTHAKLLCGSMARGGGVSAMETVDPAGVQGCTYHAAGMGDMRVTLGTRHSFMWTAGEWGGGGDEGGFFSRVEDVRCRGFMLPLPSHRSSRAMCMCRLMPDSCLWTLEVVDAEGGLAFPGARAGQ